MHGSARPCGSTQRRWSIGASPGPLVQHNRLPCRRRCATSAPPRRWAPPRSCAATRRVRCAAAVCWVGCLLYVGDCSPSGNLQWRPLGVRDVVARQAHRREWGGQHRLASKGHAARGSAASSWQRRRARRVAACSALAMLASHAQLCLHASRRRHLAHSITITLAPCCAAAGTLTQNDMVVSRLWLAGQLVPDVKRHMRRQQRPGASTQQLRLPAADALPSGSGPPAAQSGGGGSTDALPPLSELLALPAAGAASAGADGGTGDGAAAGPRAGDEPCQDPLQLLVESAALNSTASIIQEPDGAFHLAAPPPLLPKRNMNRHQHTVFRCRLLRSRAPLPGAAAHSRTPLCCLAPRHHEPRRQPNRDGAAGAGGGAGRAAGAPAVCSAPAGARRLLLRTQAHDHGGAGPRRQVRRSCCCCHTLRRAASAGSC
jgi:hypothetical protein